MLEHTTDLFLESRQIPLYHRPDFRQVNAEIVVDQHMAHLDNLWPGDLLMGLAKRGGELAGCFANDLDMDESSRCGRVRLPRIPAGRASHTVRSA